MPDDPVAGGPVSRAELEELAALFDRSEFALDPTASSAKEARSEFENRVAKYFERIRRLPQSQSLSEFVFKAKLRTLCRQYLRRNERL